MSDERFCSSSDDVLKSEKTDIVSDKDNFCFVFSAANITRKSAHWTVILK